MDMEREKTRALLVQAVTKYFDLSQGDDWKKQLLPRTPPILWFGNLSSTKPKVVTIGANPSRREFLNMKKKQAIESMATFLGGEGLIYLPPNESRFRVLSTEENLDALIHNQTLQDEVLDSYNRYFGQNPYEWFFLDKQNPYNAECFLNGMGASFFDKEEFSYSAIHLDLFPFATVDDYTSQNVQPFVKRDFFETKWAQDFLQNLIRLVDPKLIVVLGNSNHTEFKKLFRTDLEPQQEKSRFEYRKSNGLLAKSYYWTYSLYGRYDLAGISANLGNPKGFNREALRECGKHIASCFPNYQG